MADAPRARLLPNGDILATSDDGAQTRVFEVGHPKHAGWLSYIDEYEQHQSKGDQAAGVGFAYALAILVAPIGFLVGLTFLGKHPAHAAGIMALSVLSMLAVWSAVA